MTWFDADYANNALALDDLAVAADPLDWGVNFHVELSSKRFDYLNLLGPEHDAGAGQVVRCQFDRHLIAR